MSASVTDADTNLAVSCVGRRRADRDDPLELTDPMHIGSCTKALTAALVAMAAESGVVDRDQPIAELAPGRCDPGFESVTLRHVCAHQAGLPPPEEDDQIAELPPLRGNPVEQRRATTEILLAEGPVSPIGEPLEHRRRVGSQIARLHVNPPTKEPTMNTERTSLARRSTEWWPLAVLTNIACSPSISSSESSVISAVVVTVPLATLIRWYSTMSRGFGLVIVGVLVVAILGLVDLKLFPSIGIG